MLNSPSISTDLNGQTQDFIELRARGAKNGKFKNDEDLIKNNNFNNRVLINYKMKSNDTLNSIALQYSVQVSDIKRANGLVNDQDIYALPFIKIPISRLQKELFLTDLLEKQNHQIHAHYHATNASSSNNSTPVNKSKFDYLTNSNSNDNLCENQSKPVALSNLMRNSTLKSKTCTDSSKVLLLDDYNESEENSSDFENNLREKNSKFIKKTKKVIETMLQKTDATVAAVRENLSEKSPKLESGFHFIDATSPETNTLKGFWLLLLSLIFIFLIVPLVLTIFEQEGNNLHHYEQQNFYLKTAEV